MTKTSYRQRIAREPVRRDPIYGTILPADFRTVEEVTEFWPKMHGGELRLLTGIAGEGGPCHVYTVCEDHAERLHDRMREAGWSVCAAAVIGAEHLTPTSCGEHVTLD